MVEEKGKCEERRVPLPYEEKGKCEERRVPLSYEGGMNMAVVNITMDNFEEEVTNSKLPVLIDFWAVWCGPCQMQGPVVEEAAKALEGKLKIGKLNIDEEGELAQKYNVMSIPTLIMFENGEVVKKEVGFHSLDQIRAMLP